MDIHSSMRSLGSDYGYFAKCLQVYRTHTTEHQCLQEFINVVLADILARIGNGKPSINVLGIGSGSGEMDIHILCKIQEKHPGIHITIDVVEPNEHHITQYKELVSKSENLKNVNFSWNQMTSSEYEQQIKGKCENKKWDFIHMIQVLYFLDNFEETVNFFHQQLDPNGRMLIVTASDSSGWGSIYKKFVSSVPLNDDIFKLLTSEQVKEALDKMEMKCQHYDIPSVWDITKCFTDSSKEGELLLDFLTQIIDFSKTASPTLKSEFMHCLRDPTCTTMKDKSIILNNNSGALVIEP